MKQAFPDIVGNEKLKIHLAEDILSHRLSHAYILEGPKGSGKQTLAYAIAAALSCEKADDPAAPLPCGTCPACRKILSGNSPDVIRVEREGEKATLGIGVIRSVRNDVHIAPNDGEHKVYIICDAHLMTPEAQNALLLTLEEPPAYVIFLLLAEQSESLLETVRSRAHVLRTQPPDREQILAYLLQNVPEAQRLHAEAPEELAELIAAGGTGIGGAIALLSASARKSTLEQRQTVKELLRIAADRRDQEQLLATLSKLSKKGKREGSLRLMNALSPALRDLIAVKLSDSAPLSFFANREEAALLSEGFTTPRLLSLMDAAHRAAEKLQQNANVHLTLYSFASDAGLI